MFGLFPAAARAMLAAVLVAATAFVATAADPLDLKSLPRMPGETDLFTVGDSLLYISPESVDVTGRALREKFTAAGWLLFDMGRVYEGETEESYSGQDFTNGTHSIHVYVVSAPAKDNKTSVQYDLRTVAEPLPVPKDATKLAYNFLGTTLSCESTQAAEAIFEFYKTELKARGWTLFALPRPEAESKPGKTIRTHFIKESQKPLKLIVHPEEPGRTIVDIELVAHEEMIADYAPKKAPEPVSAPEEKSEPAPKSADEDADGDDPDEKFAGLVKDLIKEAMKPVAKAKKAAKDDEPDAAAAGKSEDLRPMSINVAPVPIPETANDIAFDSGEGELKFKASSRVKDLADFYREQMKSKGWKEKRSVINSDSMVVLNFSKGKKDDISFTIMRMGERTDVSARGKGLKTATPAASPKPDQAAEPDSGATSTDLLPGELPPDAPLELAAKDLLVEDKAGLPLPKPYSSSGTMKSKFQYASMASVAASVETIVAFYRSELGKRGWKEDEAAAKVTPESGTLKFSAGEGPAILKLGRQSGETTIELIVRQKAAAEASGLMPKSGNTKVMFGSILDETSEISVNGKSYKVKGGEGAERSDGPQVELKPGKYKFTVKSKGKPAQSEEAEFGADEIWGVLIGPGGVLPLQMY